MRVGANYVEIKKIIINDDKYLGNKYFFITLDRKYKVSAFQSHQAKNNLDGQRRSPGPGHRRQPKLLASTVGTGSASFDFVDSTLWGRVLRGRGRWGSVTIRASAEDPTEQGGHYHTWLKIQRSLENGEVTSVTFMVAEQH